MKCDECGASLHGLMPIPNEVFMKASKGGGWSARIEGINHIMGFGDRPGEAQRDAIHKLILHARHALNTKGEADE